MSVEKLKFWCQKVLPLTYDESLSYYEVLCKTNHKLNEVIDALNNLNPEVTDYESLTNLPSINNVELIGNKTSADLGISTDYDDLDNLPTLEGVTLQGDMTLGDFDLATTVMVQRMIQAAINNAITSALNSNY